MSESTEKPSVPALEEPDVGVKKPYEKPNITRYDKLDYFKAYNPD